jgi:hypothetical protein
VKSENLIVFGFLVAVILISGCVQQPLQDNYNKNGCGITKIFQTNRSINTVDDVKLAVDIYSRALEENKTNQHFYVYQGDGYVNSIDTESLNITPYSYLEPNDSYKVKFNSFGFVYGYVPLDSGGFFGPYSLTDIMIDPGVETDMVQTGPNAYSRKLWVLYDEANVSLPIENDIEAKKAFLAVIENKTNNSFETTHYGTCYLQDITNIEKGVISTTTEYFKIYINLSCNFKRNSDWYEGPEDTFYLNKDGSFYIINGCPT